MANILRFWPFLTSVLVGICNMDFVVIPVLKRNGLTGFNLIFFSCCLATTELAYWYWFWGWLGRYIAHLKTVHEEIEYNKEIFSKLTRHFIEKYEWAVNGNHKVKKWIKSGGHASLFLVGLNPEPASRLIGVVLCRSLNWRLGFCSLMIGNIVHTLYIIGGWNLVFSLFK